METVSSPHLPNHSSFMGIKLKHLGEIPTGLYTPFGGAKYRWEFRDFQQITRNISQTIQDSVIVTIEGE